MSERDPLMRRLADANPVPPEAVEGPNIAPPAEEVLAKVLSEHRAIHQRIRPRHRLVLAATLLSLLVIAVAVLSLSRDGPATAAELLRETAEIAATRDVPQGGGRYLYTKTVSEELKTSGQGPVAWSVVVPVTEETWVAPDGSGRIRSVFGEPRFPGPRDRERWRAAGSPELPSGISDNTFARGTLAYEDVGSLPTSPEQLLVLLRGQVGSEDPPTDIGVFLKVGQLLGRGQASPMLRAALYRVASELPGIQLVGEITDPIGRDGVGVSMSYSETGADVSVVMVFDEETADLLSEERFLLERTSWADAQPGSRLSFIAFVVSGRVVSIDSRTSL